MKYSMTCFRGHFASSIHSFLIVVSFVNRAVSVTEEDIQKLRQTFGEIERENLRLASECDFLKQENAKLWKDIERTGADVKDLQQFTRIDNVEIAGIPQRPGEKIYDIVRKVSLALGVPYHRGEISEAHRLPKAKQGFPFIVVRFISRTTRDKWLTAAKTTQCNVQQILTDAPPAPFFINQHLTSFKKGLLDMAKRLVNEGVYSYAWVKDGKVYVRKTDKSEVIRIRNFDDFDQSFDEEKKPNSFTNPGHEGID